MRLLILGVNLLNLESTKTQDPGHACEEFFWPDYLKQEYPP